jgi:hypothetical protein
MGFGFGGQYRESRRVGRPEKLRSIRLSGVKTDLWTDSSGNTHLKLHDTVVVSFNDKWITLRTGGWKTMMTKGRMNWASSGFGLGFTVDSRSSRKRLGEQVFMTEGIAGPERQVAAPDPLQGRWRRQRSRSAGDWFVEFEGAWPFDEETISLNRETHEVVEKDMVPPTDDLYRCKRQKRGQSNPGRAHAMNIAMAGKRAAESADEDADDIDVEIEDQGSIILFRLATDAAEAWWKENVSPGQMLGGRYVVEHRYADSVIEGMMSDGLNVR